MKIFITSRPGLLDPGIVINKKDNLILHKSPFKLCSSEQKWTVLFCVSFCSKIGIQSRTRKDNLVLKFMFKQEMNS